MQITSCGCAYCEFEQKLDAALTRELPGIVCIPPFKVYEEDIRNFICCSIAMDEYCNIFIADTAHPEWRVSFH